MDTSANISIDLTVGPQAAQQAIEQVIAEQKHTLAPQPGDMGITRFITKKTLFSWELMAEARVGATPTGSRVDILLDTHGNRPKALLDGKKNKKSAQKLADQIRAAAQ